MKNHRFINNLVITLIIVWLSSILFSQTENNASKFTNTYRVQICATTDKNAAVEQKQIAEEKFNISGYLIYEEPFFKARLGDFSSVQDAKAFRLKVIRAGYSGAWIVKSNSAAIIESQAADEKKASLADIPLTQEDTSSGSTDSMSVALNNNLIPESTENETESALKPVEVKPKAESALEAETKASKERKSVWATIFLFILIMATFVSLFLLIRDLYWQGDGLAASFHIFLACFYSGLAFIIMKYWLRSGWAYKLQGAPLYIIWFLIILCSVMVIFRPEFIYDTKTCSMCGRKFKTANYCPHCDYPPSEIRRPNYM